VNQADKKAKDARSHELGYKIGYTAGSAMLKYGVPGVVTFLAVKYAIRSELKYAMNSQLKKVGFK